MRPNTDPVRSAAHKHKDSESESPRDRDPLSDRPMVMELCYLEWQAAGAAVAREGRAFCRSAGNEQIILKRPGNQRSEYVGRMDAPCPVFTPIIKRACTVSGQVER